MFNDTKTRRAVEYENKRMEREESVTKEKRLWVRKDGRKDERSVRCQMIRCYGKEKKE